MMCAMQPAATTLDRKEESELFNKYRESVNPRLDRMLFFSLLGAAVSAMQVVALGG